MKKIKNYIVIAMIIFANETAFPQSLKEKAGFGGNLSGAEAMAIRVAEIKHCITNSPEFRARAVALLARLQNHPKYKEVEQDPTFTADLVREADVLVSERNRGGDVATICRGTVNN